ncbi:hypothetical protein BGX21_006915, partial [Mortierella sp. AD011]
PVNIPILVNVPEEEEAGDEDEDENSDIIVQRHLILLAHLRRVILLDAATLVAESENDWQCPYGEHHIFQDPVFKFQLFYDFKEQLLEQMASAASPHSAHSENLFESAMEKMDQVFGVMTSKLKTVDEKIKSLKENIACRTHRISQPRISQPRINQDVEK